MSTETEVILAELKEVRLVLEQINRRLSKTEVELQFEPRAVPLQRAAKMLSQGLTKTREMVKAGVIGTVEIGGRKMVPVSEITRLTTAVPTNRPAPRGRRSKTPATSGAELKAWLTKQSKRGQ